MEAPVLKHRKWRFLIRDLVAAHPHLRPVSAEVLERGLTAAASTAWWLATYQPELTLRERLTLLLPGASPIECVDEGRWFGFLPWLLARPNLAVTVILVGNELTPGDFALPDIHSLAQLDNSTTAKRIISYLTPSQQFRGTLGEWRSSVGRDTALDACILFAPGFTEHYDTWLTESELIPLMRSEVPIGAFSYSKLDALEEMEVLKRLKFVIEPTEPALNPWHQQHDMSEIIGGFAQFGWQLQAREIPAHVDLQSTDLRNFLELQDYAREDYQAFGADLALERLGARWPVGNPSTGAEDAIIVLPRAHAALESTGEVGEFDDTGFNPLPAPGIFVPEARIANRPPDENLIERICWAIELHRDWVGPNIEEFVAQSGGDFEPDDLREAAELGGASEVDLLEVLKMASAAADMRRRTAPPGSAEAEDDRLFPYTEKEMHEYLAAFLREATGEDVDAEAFLRQARLQGGLNGIPTTDWYNILDFLGWDLTEFDEGAPRRFSPAFWASTRDGGIELPVVVEGYIFNPGDDEDELAKEAFGTLPQTYPKGCILVFQSMLYKVVAGKCYTFGGMLFRNGQWLPFSLSKSVPNLDALLAQSEGQFSFETPETAYEDADGILARSFNAMVAGWDMESGQNPPMVTLNIGGWSCPQLRKMKLPR